MKCVEKIPDLTTDGLKKQTQKSGVYMIAGITEKHPETSVILYNTALLISSNGEIIAIIANYICRVKRNIILIPAVVLKYVQPKSGISRWPYVMTTSFQNYVEYLPSKGPRFCV